MTKVAAMATFLQTAISFDRPVTCEKALQDARDIMLECGFAVANDFRTIGSTPWAEHVRQLIRKQLVEDGVLVQVHVPNLSLLSFNQVDLLEDCCTDDLQKKLDEGWRILAVCPPLSERRPTYIVGRYVPDDAAGKITGGCR
jgi:hypothetical protein